MAAGLAGRALAGAANVTSAGVEACSQPASSKTVALLRQRYAIDLSSHVSRDIADLSLKGFDYIVAMKPEYTKRLTREFKVAAERIITWDVDDPFIEGTDVAYEKCLGEIERLLCGFFETIQLRPSRRD
jgi:protein-tyrosine-phosphatase